MSSTFYSYLGIVGAILCLLVPSWEAIKKSNNNKKWYNKISKLGWVLFIVALFIGIISGLGIQATTKETNQSKHDADSTRKADKADIIKSVQDTLKPHNLQYDTKTKTVRDTVTISDKKAENPLLYLSPDANNPILKTTNVKDSLVLILRVKNFGKGVVRNPQSSFIIFSVFNNTINIINTSLKASGNPNSIIPENSIEEYVGTGSTHFYDKDTVFVYFKVDYQNNTYQNQPPFRKLVFCTHDLLNQGLFDVNSERYYVLKKLLLKNSLW